MIFGYARVSTTGQALHGNSLEEQISVLQEHNCDEIITEAYTGKTMDRPEFNKLYDRLHSGDTLIVTKLDRLARTVIEGVQTVQDLSDKGVSVDILNMGRVENTPLGKTILTVMLAFAELERDMIAERTQEGKRRSGNYGGRIAKFPEAQAKHAVELLSSHSYSEVERLTGISKSTLQRYKKKYENQEA